MPVASLVHQIVQSLVGHGYGQQDFATVIELQAQASGLALVTEHAEVSDGLEPAGDAAIGPDGAAVRARENQNPKDTTR